MYSAIFNADAAVPTPSRMSFWLRVEKVVPNTLGTLTISVIEKGLGWREDIFFATTDHLPLPWTWIALNADLCLVGPSQLRFQVVPQRRDGGPLNDDEVIVVYLDEILTGRAPVGKVDCLEAGI